MSHSGAHTFLLGLLVAGTIAGASSGSLRADPPSRTAQLEAAETWMYQIQDLAKDGAIAALAATEHPMLVLEPGHNVQDEPFDTPGMVAALRTRPSGKPRLLLAYLDVGQAESWRDYWQKHWKAPTRRRRGRPDFLLSMDPDGWSDNYPVAYWRKEWKEIWLGPSGIVATVARLGFDGVYLDWVEGYDDDHVRAAAKQERVHPAREMIRFVEEIGAAGRAASAGFLVVVQNAPYLIDEDPKRYAAAIDALAVEDTWFHGAGDADWQDPRAGDLTQRHEGRWSTESRLAQYRKYLDGGLPVFSVDYCIEQENVDLVYARAWRAGLRPLVTRVSLSRISATPPPRRREPSGPAATGRERRSITKWDLWSGPVTLRGANIWQAFVDDKEVYDGDFGPGPVGPPFTPDDFRRLAGMGANLVNISHPGLFRVRPPYGLDLAAQRNLDRLLGMITAADLFAVISFRTGPGRSEFTFSHGESWDEDEREGWFPKERYDERVWSDAEVQKAWAAMWRHTAERYRTHAAVVGYDLMVEPNANDTVAGVEEPAAFYPAHTGKLEDWNALYPKLVRAVRAVDAETPILVGAMGHSAVRWLPYLEPISAPRLVYVVHQYAPEDYTHQDPPLRIRYPGRIDLDWDGRSEPFNRDVLAGIFETIASVKRRRGIRVATNEMGLMRFQPGAAAFMADQLELFEQHEMNNAVWAWYPSFLARSDNDDFNFQHGPKPGRHRDVKSSRFMDVLRTYWKRNRLRPSGVAFRPSPEK